MDDTAARRQFDAIVERAGLTIPADRYQTMLGTYEQVLAWSKLVHEHPRPGSAEPSNVYDLRTVGRLAEHG